MTSPFRLAFRLVAVTAATLVLSSLPPRLAAANDGPPREGEGEEGPSIEQKIKAQMEKIVRLMKENEKAILEASQGSGKAPKPVDVKPPDLPDGQPPPGAPPPAMSDDGGDGKTPPPGKGEEIRKKMDELIQGTGTRGQQIPGELEELIKMIPVHSGQSPSQGDSSGKPLPNPNDAEARKRENKPDDGKDPKGSEKSKKTPSGERRDPSDTPPKGGETGDERRDGVPAWLTELPPEVRTLIEQGNTEKVPEDYRPLIERYRAWLLEHAGKR